MAKKVSVLMVDDLDGTEMDDKGETMSFGLDGVTYEIDLSSKNAQALRKALMPYVDVARKVEKRGRPKSTGAQTRRDPAQTKSIKEWGAENGFDVPARGRLPLALVDAYEKAHS